MFREAGRFGRDPDRAGTRPLRDQIGLADEGRDHAGGVGPRFRKQLETNKGVDMDHLKLRELGIPGCLPDFKLVSGKTAFMMVDMYNRAVDDRFGFAVRAREHGIEDQLDHYYTRLRNTVIPNMSKLLETCRKYGIPPIHVKVGVMTTDANDAGWRYKGWKIFASPNGELDIIDKLKPLEGEVVVNKTSSGVFNSTNIERILLNMGIECLIVGGVITGNCVETAVRDASDRDFKVYLVEDCCASVSEEAHNFSIAYMHKNYALAKKTDEVVSEIEQTWRGRNT